MSRFENDHHPHFLSNITGALVTAAILFVIWLAQAWVYIRCTDIFSTGCKVQILTDLREFQTLVGAMLALIAATIAAIPVYKQLAKMHFQTAIMSRELLVKKVRATEARREFAKSSSERISRSVYNALGLFDFELDPEPMSADSAFGIWQDSSDLLRKLEKGQKLMSDPQNVNQKRQLLIASLDALRECLDDIHRPAHANLDDFGLSEEQIREAELALENAEEIAQANVLRLANEFEGMAKILDDEFEKTLWKIRYKIYQIDNLLFEVDVK